MEFGVIRINNILSLTILHEYNEIGFMYAISMSYTNAGWD